MLHVSRGVESLPEYYSAVRTATTEICRPLQTEDYVVQTDVFMSPPRWHLGHTTWFFEMILRKFVPGYNVFNEKFLYFFNSYYDGFGKRIDRNRRGSFSRPAVSLVYEYRNVIDARMSDLLARIETLADAAEIARLVRLGLEHEIQHQELLVYDIKHLLCDEYGPHHTIKPPQGSSVSGEVEVEGGLFRLGYAGEDFAYDNEMPEHTVFVQPYAIDRRPVTNAEYLAFINDGGYRDYRWWFSEGLAKVKEQEWEAPLYWERHDDVWLLRDYLGLRALPQDEPVTHISYYEASAYAKWAGKRLPTEAEWEMAACYDPVSGEKRAFPWGEGLPEESHANLFENRLWNVAPAGAYPRGESPLGCHQMIGDVWEWTSSDYVPYPGFQPQFDEYNDKWFVNQKVLRGGSWATPRSHIRSTYRNFFHPDERWMISGLRCARTLDVQ